ncbi:MAG: hypothetical protein ACP5SH_09950, partial [Syntrophobacteraceae bacterium]
MRMKSFHNLLKNTLIAAAFVAATFFTAQAAQATTITFNALPGVGVSISSYTENGYTLTGPNLVTTGYGYETYDGLNGIFANTVPSTTTLIKVGGGSFNLDSITIAQLFTSIDDVGAQV